MNPPLLAQRSRLKLPAQLGNPLRLHLEFLESRCFTAQPICAAVHDEPVFIQEEQFGLYVRLRSDSGTVLHQAYCQKCVLQILTRFFADALAGQGLTCHITDTQFRQASETLPCWRNGNHLIQAGSPAIVLFTVDRARDQEPTAQSHDARTALEFDNFVFCAECAETFLRSEVLATLAGDAHATVI